MNNIDKRLDNLHEWIRVFASRDGKVSQEWIERTYNVLEKFEKYIGGWIYYQDCYLDNTYPNTPTMEVTWEDKRYEFSFRIYEDNKIYIYFHDSYSVLRYRGLPNEDICWENVDMENLPNEVITSWWRMDSPKHKNMIYDKPHKNDTVCDHKFNEYYKSCQICGLIKEDNKELPRSI